MSMRIEPPTTRIADGRCPTCGGTDHRCEPLPYEEDDRG